MADSLMPVARRFHFDMGPSVRAYLNGRGISDETIEVFLLGEVTNPLPEFEDYRGRISIPYVTKLGGVVGFKFRRPNDEGDEAKFLSSHMSTRLYNTLAFEQAEKVGYIAIAEGEPDTWILDGELDIPTVGVPGVDTWLKHPEWKLLFDGFNRVLVFADQDDAGRKLEARIRSDVPAAVPVRLPAKDVNETFLRFGGESIREAAGIDDR